MLPIRQTLNALPVLKAGPKAVLIEVCELAENGERGICDAKNDYLVRRLGGTERTITRMLAQLEQRGLLLSYGAGKARRLAPTEALRACYTAATELTRRLAIAALNLDKNGAEPSQPPPANLDQNEPQPRQYGEVGEVANLDKSGSEPRQKWSTNLDKSGSEPRQNGSRVIGDDQYDHLNDQHDGWVRASVVVGLKKKIGLLEAELATLKAQTPAPSTPVARPPSFPHGRDPEAFPPQLNWPFDSEEWRAAWVKWRRYLAEFDKAFRGDTHEEQALIRLTQLAGTDEALAVKIIEDSIANGWKNLTLHVQTNGTTHRRNNGPAAAAGRVSTLSASAYTSGRKRPSSAA